MMDLGGYLVKRLSLTLGFNDRGQPMELQLVSSPTRKIVIEPGRVARVFSRNMVDGAETVQEFPFERYMSWSYTFYNDEEPDVQPEEVFAVSDDAPKTVN